MKIEYHLITSISDERLKQIELREADRQELSIFCPGMSQLEMIHKCVENSTNTFLVTIDDKPEVLFGVTEYLTHASPWMVSSNIIEKIPLQFCKLAMGVIEEFLNVYKYLTNYVDARNTVHCKWLKWMGFQFIPKYDYIYNKHHLHYFELKED